MAELKGENKNSIKVLVLIPSVDRAGAQAVALNYMRKIDREKIKYDFFVSRPEKSDYENEIEAMGGTVYHIAQQDMRGFGAYKKAFRKFLSEHSGYQVIHSYLDEKSCFALSVAKEKNIPIRICHGQSIPARFDWKLPLKYYRKLRLRKYYTHKMACSSEVAGWLFGAVRAKHTVIMKNAVDTALFQKDFFVEQDVRKEFGLEDKLVVGHVGRFTREKNQKFLVDVFAEIHRRNPNSVLIMIDGADGNTEVRYRDKVKERVKQMRLESSVILIERRNDIDRIMQAFDVLVMPSNREGFPITLVEAQSLGVRCVVSDVIAPKCNLTGNVQFLPLELRSSVWADRILQYLKEPMADKTYKVIDKGYDIKSNAIRLQKFYISEWRKYKILQQSDLV